MFNFLTYYFFLRLNFSLVFVLNCRAHNSAHLFREAEQAKVEIKAAQQRESVEAKAVINTLDNKVKAFKKNRESVQQHRHEANRAIMELDRAYAEARQLEKQNEQLKKVAETSAQK